MKRYNTVILIFVALFVGATFFCLRSYTKVKSLKKQLLIEQTKVNFIKANTDVNLMPFDSVYVSKTDTVHFYKNGEYLGKSITVTE